MIIYRSSKNSAVIDCHEKIKELYEEIARLKGVNKRLRVSLEETAKSASACFRVIAINQFGPEKLELELRLVGVKPGFGKRAKAALDAAKDSK